MENLIRLLPARPQPLLVRLGATAAMVLVSFLLRMGIEERAGPYGFVLFIPAIVAASVVFDRHSGFFATALTIILVSLLLHWSGHVQAHLASVASFGVVSAGLGLALGLILCRNLFAVDFFAAITTNLTLIVPWEELALICGAAIAASAIAALIPAWQAGRIAPADALRYE